MSQNSNHELENRVTAQGINYSLEAVKTLLTQFGNPQLNLPPIIHIAGTNGKGSVVAFIESALNSLGYSTGTYTSPHLISYCERYRLNGITITETELKKYYDKVRHIQTATEFELLTLIAWLYFKDKHPDYLIIETGLGGRLDATNVITPIVSVITRIGLDHQSILGNTIPKIAREKAGIIKPKIPIITGPQRPEALKIIQQVAMQNKSPFILANSVKKIPAHYTLQGHYQAENVAIAKTVLTHLFGEKSLKKAEKGLANAKNWGRFTVANPNNTHTIIIDAGHNEDGITATLKTIKAQYPTHKLKIIVGFKQQKNAKEMLNLLTAASQEIAYCEFDTRWAMSYQEISKLNIIPLPPISIDSIITHMTKHHPLTPEITLITGSIYFIGKLKAHRDCPLASQGSQGRSR